MNFILIYSKTIDSKQLFEIKHCLLEESFRQAETRLKIRSELDCCNASFVDG